MIDFRQGYGRGLFHRDDILNVLDMASDGDILYFDKYTFAYLHGGGLSMFGPPERVSRITDFIEENSV